MILSEKQRAFSRKLSEFILRLNSMGYEVTFGEAWRPPETAKKYSEEGKGIPNSLHCSRLAMDLVLWKGGKCLPFTIGDYEPAGTAWELMSDPGVQCCWGGRFGDCDHFSISHNGVK